MKLKFLPVIGFALLLSACVVDHPGDAYYPKEYQGRHHYSTHDDDHDTFRMHDTYHPDGYRPGNYDNEHRDDDNAPYRHNEMQH